MTLTDALNCLKNELNPALGIEHSGGNENVFFSSLLLFIEETEKSCKFFLELTDFSDFSDVFLNIEILNKFISETHGLKGSLLNIGAMHLSAQAARLEDAARKKNYGFCIENMVLFAKKLTEFNIKLRSVTDEYKENYNNKNTITSVDKDIIYPDLLKLKDALSDFDIENAEEIINILKDLGMDVRVLERFLARYDFEAAIEFIDNI